METLNNQADKLVSIIIPAYNVENYIDECLNSIMMQTYSKWEAIIVDDGSKDDTWKHISNYSSMDSRFRGIHVENGGVSKARNLALNQVKGQYILFVDSDDTINKNTIETLVTAIEANPEADLVNYQYYRVDENGNSFADFNFHEGYISTIDEVEKMDLIINCLLDYQIGYEVWGKLYKSSVVKNHNIRFNDACHIGEDLAFNVCYCLYANGINCIKDRFYNYRVRDNSAMATSNELSKIFQERLILLEGLYDTFEETLKTDEINRFYQMFYKAMLYASAGFTPKETVDVARNEQSDFYEFWLSEALRHKAEFKKFYPKEKVNLFYHYGFYIKTNLENDFLGKIYLRFYDMYRRLRNRPTIGEWRLT